MTTRIRLIWWVGLLLWTTGCGGGAVVFAPTPAPPDLSPLRYAHPSGAFTIDVPRDWSVLTHATDQLAAAHFTPSDESQPLLTVAVIHAQELVDNPNADLIAIINSYQSQIRPDAGRYSEQDRQAMADGSWRLAGLRQTVGGATLQINTFIERAGAYLGVLEIVIPAATTRRAELETAANTLDLNPQAGLPSAPLATLSVVYPAQIAVSSVHGWTTPEGVFFLTGEIVNRSAEPVAPVPVRVELLTASGDGVAEAQDVSMGYGIPPGGFAPFSLRFGQGQPADATTFALAIGGNEPPTPPQILGAESLTWTDDSTLTDEGHLLISGTLTNTGTQPVRDPLAAVTVFDASRQVIGAWFEALAEGVLQPGDSITFSVRVPELGGQPNRYIVSIQARPA